MALLEVVCGGRLLWLLLVVAVVPSRGFQFGEDLEQKSCCYGDDDVKHGHVAISLPSCCLLQVCQNGRIEDWPVGRPGDKHCCEFEGQLYPEGSRLAAQCLSLECKAGRWTPSDSIEVCCKHCYLYNDPHVSMFDGHSYDWHGTCNHTVTQTGFTLQPEVGVFSDFEPCNGVASCLAHTTFRDNPHTIITLDNQDVYNLVVNGEKFPVPAGGVHPVRSSSGRHPVLVWREDHCVYLLGSSKLMLQHCEHRLDVWAHPSHTDRLHGLCGHFNSYQEDDFRDRLGGLHTLHPRPKAFPESWRTSEQSDQRCHAPCSHCNDETTEDQCRATPGEREEYSHRCRKLLHPIIGRDNQLLPHVHNCAFDVCMMRQNGASDEEVDRWLVEVQVILQQNKIILARTLDGQRPNTQPLPNNIRCTQGSHWKINCNWCRCSENGLGIICTLIACLPEYVHEFGEDACEDGSRWRVDKCNSCVCVRGGNICSLDSCDSSKPKRCLLDIDAGPCEALIRRYAYNRVTNRCEEFYYGGCLGNENNFETQEGCWETCRDDTVGGISRPEECLLAKDPGPCYGSFPRYAYNSETEKCDLFIFGGCQGNANNFKSLQECKTFCKGLDGTGSTDQEKCLLDKDSGPCLAYFNRYAYNLATGKCEPFIYGGCQGNENNFETLQDCWEACGGFIARDTTILERCLQDEDPGQCNQQLTRFAYNQATDQCDSFIYGGCLGNENNFLTLRECQEVCGGLRDIVCEEPVCAKGCQITIDVASGCPTCSCIDCPELTCPSTCQVIHDPQTECPACEC